MRRVEEEGREVERPTDHQVAPHVQRHRRAKRVPRKPHDAAASADAGGLQEELRDMLACLAEANACVLQVEDDADVVFDIRNHP